MKIPIALIIAALAFVSIAALQVDKKEHPWRVQVFNDSGTPTIEVLWRTEYHTSDTKELIGRRQLPVSRRTMTEIAEDSITLTSGKELTGAEFFEALRRFAAAWRLEDKTPQE